MARSWLSWPFASRPAPRARERSPRRRAAGPGCGRDRSAVARATRRPDGAGPGTPRRSPARRRCGSGPPPPAARSRAHPTRRRARPRRPAAAPGATASGTAPRPPGPARPPRRPARPAPRARAPPPSPGAGTAGSSAGSLPGANATASMPVRSSSRPARRGAAAARSDPSCSRCSGGRPPTPGPGRGPGSPPAGPPPAARRPLRRSRRRGGRARTLPTGRPELLEPALHQSPLSPVGSGGGGRDQGELLVVDVAQPGGRRGAPGGELVPCRVVALHHGPDRVHALDALPEHDGPDTCAACSAWRSRVCLAGPHALVDAEPEQRVDAPQGQAVFLGHRQHPGQVGLRLVEAPARAIMARSCSA